MICTVQSYIIRLTVIGEKSEMDQQNTEEEITEVVQDYIQKLMDSGYSHNHRKEILRSGCEKFCRRQIEDLTGGRQLYWTKGQMKAARKAKKLSNQYLFKSSRGGR